MAKCDFVPIENYKNISVIELESTMRLIDELAEALGEIRFHEQKYVESSPEETTYYLRVTNKALEKYKKFKEGLK